MNLAPATAIDLAELPAPPQSPFGAVGSLLGRAGLETALPPPDQIQARMPFDLEWK